MSVLQASVGTDVEILDRFVQVLCLVDIDCYEFQNSVLSDDTDHHWSASLVVIINDWYSPCPRVNHSSACFI